MLKVTTKIYMAAALMLALSSNAYSKEISYDYIQGTYSSITDSSLDVDVDGNGFGVSGSFSVAPAIAITAGFGAVSFDRIQGIDVDATSLTFGVTAHTSIAPGTDIYGNFSVLKGDVEASDGFITVDDDDTGNSISVGLRFSASDAVELEVMLSRVDIFDETDNVFAVGARFYANDKVSLAIGYATADDVDTLSLNARIDFK